MLVAHKEDGRWGTALDRDFADWRGRASGTGRGPAVGELQVAEGLAAMPEVADAVAGGELTLEHARALTRLRATGSAEVKAALEGGAAADLVAKGKSLSAPELAREAKKVAAAIDAQAAQDSFAAVWRRRSVATRRGAGGRVGEWFLDDVGGTIVETALDAIVGKPGTDDDRTREQRRADALVTMASRVLQVGADRVGAQIRPHLALIVEEQTWAALLARRAAIEAADQAAVDAAAGFTGAAFGLGPDGLPRALGTLDTAGTDGRDTAGTDTSGTDCGGAGGGRDGCVPARRVVLPGLPPLPNVAPAVLEDGSLVPGGELDRIVCDCQVTRIVMDAASMPLDVGQTQRLYNRELRRAVTTRDRHCQWPGCSIRAAWCEVHHVWFWANGGPTALCNGCTLCIYHHHRVHDEHIRITILADGFDFHYRDGRHLGTTHRPPRPSGARRATTGNVVPDALTPARTTCHDPLIESWPPTLDQTPRAGASTGPATTGTRKAQPTATTLTSATSGADGTGTPRPGAPPGSQPSAPPGGQPGAPPGGQPGAPPGGQPGAPPGSQRGAPPGKSAGAHPQPLLWVDGIPAGQATEPPF
ncbi:DUF222 domain-containing protein [Georgenia yuyongxinii]|uniref:HNH endonuclease n=1 Tax=Georgenia yuyongxinii TaxID=2589797 RepID=UPI00143D1D0F|nr:HNH endonuclease signature motif containing protein [Georgenia yuyongxinii]